MPHRYNLFDQEYWSSIVSFSIFLWIVVWLAVMIILAVYQYRKYRYNVAQRKVDPVITGIIQDALVLGLHEMPERILLHDKGVNVSNVYEYHAARNLLKNYFQLLSGEYRTFIVQIFADNKLNKRSLKKLKSRWASTREVLTILSDLSLTREPVSMEVAEQLLASKSTQVRRGIREYLIKIQGMDAVPLIFSHVDTLSKLDVVELYESIKLYKKDEKIYFHQYLHVENDLNFNYLLLDLVTRFQEYDAQETLLALFNEGPADLREKVVNTMGKLSLYEVEGYLMARYPSETPSIQLEILKALGRLSSGLAREFLLRIFQDMNLPTDFRKHALRSLYAIRNTAPGMIENLERVSQDDNLRLIAFVKHPLVKYI